MVVSLNSYRAYKDRLRSERQYRDGLGQPAPSEGPLPSELLRCHDTYLREPFDLGATIRARYLLDILEARAELTELRELSRELRGKLQARLYRQIQNLRA
jgi:hypothetical protein